MGAPNTLVPLALFAFAPVVVLCLRRFGPRGGVLAALVGGWMLLPSFDGYFDPPLLHTRRVFVPAIVLLVTLVLDPERWRGLRLRALDLPVLVLSVTPFMASVTNGLGAYDGAQATFEAAMTWAAPWFIGRVYFGGARSLTRVATFLVGAALLYVPALALEARVSPQIHRFVYGFHPFTFAQMIRSGGFRPSVFMSHGLMLSMFIATAALAAYWVWRTRARRRVASMPAAVAAAALVGGTLLCRSAGAILLLAVGIGVLEIGRRTGSVLALMLLLAVPPAYCAARVSGWSGEILVELAERYVNPDRAGSLAFRLANEDLLIRKALQQPWVGWGRWGRSRVYDEDGSDITITDGMWIIQLGVAGVIGLVSLWLVIALPPILLLRRHPAPRWSDPRLAAPAALAVALLLWAIDDVLNSMMSPLFPVFAGAIASFSALPARTRPRARPPALAPAPLPPRPAPWTSGHAL